MIRTANINDKDRIIRLLADSHKSAGFDGAAGFTFPFDAAYAERLFLAHVKESRALCLIYAAGFGVPQGVLMATASEHPFGPVWLARETVWWIDPAHRGGVAAVRMLDAYENWATAQGCAFAGMAGMGDDPAVAKLYQRRGYGVAETHYLKLLAVAA